MSVSSSCLLGGDDQTDRHSYPFTGTIMSRSAGTRSKTRLGLRATAGARTGAIQAKYVAGNLYITRASEARDDLETL